MTEKAEQAEKEEVQTEEKVEEKSGSAEEQKAEVKAEEKPEEKAEEKPEKPEEKLEEKPEEKPEEKVEKVEEKAEKKLEEKAEKKPEEKPERKPAEKVEKKVKLSGKTAQIMESIKGLSVLELSELVKALEEEFGVTAAAPVAMGAPAGAGAAGGGSALAAAEEEKAEFDVILSNVGEKKIEVIKVVRSVTSLGLKEAKALVDEAPNPVKEKVTKEEAEKVKKLLEEAGATAALK